MASPLLSICIPTFNRSDCLKECLNSITIQFRDPKVLDRVEIVVSDNASQDGTFGVVQEFQNQYSNIVYKKNQTNFGVDRNILQVVDMAKGKYVWLLGDDDSLFSDALVYLLNFLETDKADYIIANCWGYNKTLTDRALKYPNLSISEDKLYEHLSDYVIQAPHNRDLVGLLCGLSVQIFLKQLWTNKQNKEKDIGTNAVHMYTLTTVMKDRRFCLLAKPCVKVRADNIRWDVFDGLETLKKRSDLTKQALLKILTEYNIPYSRLKVNLAFAKTLLFDELRIAIRARILKSQKSRDVLKRILGKL